MSRGNHREVVVLDILTVAGGASARVPRGPVRRSRATLKSGAENDVGKSNFFHRKVIGLEAGADLGFETAVRIDEIAASARGGGGSAEWRVPEHGRDLALTAVIEALQLICDFARVFEDFDEWRHHRVIAQLPGDVVGAEVGQAEIRSAGIEIDPCRVARHAVRRQEAGRSLMQRFGGSSFQRLGM